MFKKMFVVGSVILLCGIIFVQEGEAEEFYVGHNEFCVGMNFINMKPINDYIYEHGGFPSFSETPLLFSYAQKDKIDNKTYLGLRFMTTLSGFAALTPDFLKREISSDNGANKAEMSITMVEFLFEYEFLKFGGFFINGGAGLGIGGSTLTLLGENSGRLWTVSALIKPQVRVGYNFLEGTDASFILALNTAYNYLPVTGWNCDAGNLDSFPQPFDLSCLSVDIGITFPFATR